MVFLGTNLYITPSEILYMHDFMKWVILAPVLLLVFAPSILAAGQEEFRPGFTYTIMDFCKTYYVELNIFSSDISCYDVKIDITTPEGGRIGEIFDPREGWKSSYYYVDDDFCIKNNESNETHTYKLRADTEESLIYFQFSIRKNTSSEILWESNYFDIEPECIDTEQYPDDNLFWLGGLIALVVILAGVVLYVKVFR